MRDLSILNEKMNQLTAYFQKQPSILTVYLFGSFGTKSQTNLSDLDIGILYDSKLSLLEELGCTAEISSILGIEKVDLINLNEAPVYFQHQVLSTGEKIYEKNFEKTADFVEEVLEEFHDYEFILRKFREDFQAGLREEYLGG